MKFNLKTAHPWHEFSSMILGAQTMNINGFDGDVDIELVDGVLSVKMEAKPAKSAGLKILKGGKK